MIGDAFLQIHNFQSLMGIVAGLNIAACRRLKTSWSLLPPSVLQTLTKFERILSPQNSFKEYRSVMRDCVPPVLPYLGVYLSDLTAIDSGNPDFIRGLVNMEKHELIFDVIEKIRFYQADRFDFPPEPSLQHMLAELCPLPEADLYCLSLFREPRK
mgnify:CR=1 FL=1